jgi:hypothetical protein
VGDPIHLQFFQLGFHQVTCQIVSKEKSNEIYFTNRNKNYSTF